MININDKTQCFKLSKLFEELNNHQDLITDGGYADIKYCAWLNGRMYIQLENTFGLKDNLTLVLMIDDEYPEAFYLTTDSETGQETSYDYDELYREANDIHFCEMGCYNHSVYKSKTDSYYCEEHKIAFYCEVCGVDVWRDGEQHDDSKCDESGEKWYCPNCDEKNDDEESDDGEDKCDDCGDDERIGQCVNLDCNKLFCAKHGRAWTDEDAPDNIFCSEKCYDKVMEEEKLEEK